MKDGKKSPQEQVKALDARLGVEVGAAKERLRLKKQIEELTNKKTVVK